MSCWSWERPASRWSTVMAKVGARPADPQIGDVDQIAKWWSSEVEAVVLLFGGRIHPPSLIAGERPFLVVGRDQVLPRLGTDRLHQVSSVSEHRKVAQQGMSLLHQVTGGHPAAAAATAATACDTASSAFLCGTVPRAREVASQARVVTRPVQRRGRGQDRVLSDDYPHAPGGVLSARAAGERRGHPSDRARCNGVSDRR